MTLYFTHYSWIGSLSNARAEGETDGTSKPDTDEEEDEEVLQHQQDDCASVRAGKQFKNCALRKGNMLANT